MKREFSLLIIGLFLMSVMVPMVVAENHDGSDIEFPDFDAEEAGEGVVGFIEGIRNFFGPIMEALFPESGSDGSENFSKALFAIILAMFVYTAVDQFFGDKALVKWIATISITLVAFIGMPDGFLESIAGGYGAMGFAILSAIPFAVILWFTIKSESLLISRVTWVFFSMYYLGLFLFAVFSNGDFSGWEKTVRLIGFGVGAGLFWFIVPLRDWITKGEVQAHTELIQEDENMRAMGRGADRRRGQDAIEEAGN